MAAKPSGVQRYIASAVWCLGQTYSQLGNCDTSYNHIQEAYRLFNALPPGEVESQRLSGLCGIDLVEVRYTLQVDEVVSLAWDVKEKCTAMLDDLIHGCSLLVLRKALYSAQQWQEALCYLSQARTMFKAIGNTFNLARANQFISWVRYAENRLPDVLDAIEEAWKYAELSTARYIQISISLDLGRIFFSANQDTKAWKHLEIALTNASYIGHRIQVACTLEYMGYGYLCRGDYQNAYGAYEAAAEKYLGIVDDCFAERCKENMARIERKQGNLDTVIGFHRPPIDIDKTLFYTPVQALASELPIFHS